MIEQDRKLRDDTAELCRDVSDAYMIEEEYYRRTSVKRGLRNEDGTGVMIGITKIGSVQGYYVEDGEKIPMPGRLYYRGIDVADIVEAHRRAGTFGYEEVAYLLLMGRLPTSDERRGFVDILSEARPLPHGFFEDMILKVTGNSVMNVLARCVMALYAYDSDPENNALENLVFQSIQLIARFPGIVATAYAAKRHQFDHKSLFVHNPRPELSVSENFLRMLRPNKEFEPDEAHMLDLMMILHAEHGGGNNSTFACRSLSSTGTDTYSAIAGAVCSLKGPLHGGANSKVMDMMADITEHVRDTADEDELRAYIQRLLSGDAGDRSGKIYGMGHAVYTVSDPRARILKQYARSFAEARGRLADLELYERVERIGVSELQKRKKNGLPVCANVDFYSGFIYDMLRIPQELFTPLFAAARIAGWCAHRIEEIATCRRIMRPAYRAPLRNLPYIPEADR